MKILVAIDNSQCSASAFDHVLNSYWPLEAEFEVILVVEPIVGHYPLAMTYVDSMFEAEEELRKEARQFVTDKVAVLKEKFPMGRADGAVFEGPIADTILDRAEKWKADLIVLGSHSRKGLSRFLLGSVAEKVASHAPCSVEIVRGKEAAKDSGETKAKAATTKH